MESGIAVLALILLLLHPSAFAGNASLALPASKPIPCLYSSPLFFALEFQSHCCFKFFFLSAALWYLH